MNTSSPLYSIVLAAGKGRRMRNRVLHKVCFQIAGIPAIQRALDTYNRCGIVRNVVVVGELSGQVVEIVGRQFDNAVFVYQPDARGTGDAARCGLQALTEISPDARILVTAGDKLVESAAVGRLVQAAIQTEADLALLVSPAAWGGNSAGRVLCGADGRPLGIVEMADARLYACRDELRELLERRGASVEMAERDAILKSLLGPSGTWAKVLETSDADTAELLSDRAALLARLHSLPYAVTAGSPPRTFAPREIASAPLRNEFVYLIRKSALEYGLEQLHAVNAQGELYLTDAIGAICSAQSDGAPRFRVVSVSTQSPTEVMSYNDPEELLRIEDHFHGQRRQTSDELQRRLGVQRLKTVTEWLELLPDEAAVPQETFAAFGEYYGDDAALMKQKVAAYRAVLKTFRQHFGEDRRVLLVRSPGRINLMGRHVDWQGGHCNLMAVTQEVLMAIAPRADDRIEARNFDPAMFPDVSTSIGRLVSRLNWDDWLAVVNSSGLVRHLRESGGNWNLYLEAALLRLQMAHRQQQLSGMDMAVSGNIPVAAGLSSSSALVVATAEAALAINGLEVAPQQFVNFCGEGEWFVGTRGGSADHAAMKYGRKGTINHVKFHDFQLLEQLAFPETHALVVCNSFVQAKKAGGAREAFNARVGSYLIGVQLVRREFRQYAPLIRFVRDISCETLCVGEAEIYRILQAIPESVTAAEVRALFAADAEAWAGLEQHFERVPDEMSYPVRGVLMFGIAECARAVRAADCLRRRDVAELGELMRISHDGERLFSTFADGSAEPFAADIADSALERLIDDLDSLDPALSSGARLYRQPGAYRCSTREIDELVDIAGRTPGVAGAQIAGAGLGGCAMVLVQRDALDLLEANLLREFYRPRGLPSGVVRCTPSAGSGVVEIHALESDAEDGRRH